MPKPALGKSLGNLMDPGERPATESMPLWARQASEHQQEETREGAPARRRLGSRVNLELPLWAFAAVDLLLLGSAAWLVHTSPRPINLLLVAYCAVLFTAGATFFCLPFLAKPPAPRQRPATEKLPKWLVGDSTTLGTGKQLLIHLHWPRFVGEATRLPNGERGMNPVWIDPPAELSTLRRSQLMKEAVEFFEKEHLSRSRAENRV